MNFYFGFDLSSENQVRKKIESLRDRQLLVNRKEELRREKIKLDENRIYTSTKRNNEKVGG